MIQINRNIFPTARGAYIVGGSIRDLLLHQSPADYDLAIVDDPQKYAQQIASNTAGRIIEIGKADQKILRVISKNNIFDISQINGSCIEEDLRQRDFTINAMAYEISSGRIIDCSSGRQDLADKKIRMVSNRIFKKDPIRLLRAYRMGASLNFSIETKTAAAIGRHAGLIRKSAGERIREELYKMFQNTHSHYSICRMADTGLLFEIFPELADLKRRLRNRDQQLTAFESTLKAFGHLEGILKNDPQLIPHIALRSFRDANKTRAILLKCAMLLHDIGKPAGQTPDKEAASQFYGHESKSAQMSLEICKRLRFSNRHKDYVHFIIHNQTRPISLFRAYQNKTLTHAKITQFFVKYRNHTPDLLLQALALNWGKEVQTDDTHRAFLDFTLEMIRDYFTFFKPRESLPPLITGHDLIDEFGLRPSALFKSILNYVEEKRLTEKKMTRKDAIKLVKEFVKGEESGSE